MSEIWTAVFIATTLICATKWLKWKISTLAMAYYIEKNQYKQPTDEEIAECTGWVAKNMIKDLTGR